MKKNFIPLLLALCLMTALSGCGGAEKEPFDAAAMAAGIREAGQFEDLVEELPATSIPFVYGLDAADYVTGVAYCGTGATAEEILVFQAADEAAAERIYTLLQSHLTEQLESYRSYVPSEVPKLENAILRRSGVYVAAVVCGDAKAAAKVVDRYM